MQTVKLLLNLVTIGLLFIANAESSDQKNQITILYDSFGAEAGYEQDWGFSALIKFQGQHILFDTGNKSKIFKHNVETANVDLSIVDFAVISHRHGDHIDGLYHLFEVKPTVPVYTPDEEFVLFARVRPTHKYKEATSRVNSGPRWQDADIIKVDNTQEIAPNVFVISTVRKRSGSASLQELSLALQTSEGLVVIVGCSHPGITNIITEASKIDARIVNIFGGLHLLRTPSNKITSIANSLRNELNVQEISPGHCTGKTAKEILNATFKKDFNYAGLGTTLPIPD